MKIYFEDGKLLDIDEINKTLEFPDEIDLVIDAAYGITHNMNNINTYKKCFNGPIYTNSIFLLANRYVWNPELKVPEAYIRNKEGKFVRIDLLTPRELREGHDIAKMYLSGEFGQWYHNLETDCEFHIANEIVPIKLKNRRKINENQ